MNNFILLKHAIGLLLFSCVASTSTNQRDLSHKHYPSSDNNKIYASAVDAKADLLFKQVKTKISDTEKGQVANQLKLLKYDTKNKKLTLSITDDAAEDDDFSPSFDISVYPVDYNNDGLEEIFIFLSSSFLSGTASPPSIYVFYKVSGQYKLIHEGEAYKIRINELKKTGFPELCLADEEKWIKSNSPVPGSLFIWNGNVYKESKIKTAKPDTFKWMDVMVASKNYQKGI